MNGKLFDLGEKEEQTTPSDNPFPHRVVLHYTDAQTEGYFCKKAILHIKQPVPMKVEYVTVSKAEGTEPHFPNGRGT
jgi:hypothetical protein